MPRQQQQPPPLDPPMVPFALAGMAGWAVAGVTLLLAKDWLDRTGHTNWLWICLAGFLLGLPGLALMVRHDAHRGRVAPPQPAPGEASRPS